MPIPLKNEDKWKERKRIIMVKRLKKGQTETGKEKIIRGDGWKKAVAQTLHNCIKATLYNYLPGELPWLSRRKRN